jgi:mono/diheme cytochrome c family protein
MTPAHLPLRCGRLAVASALCAGMTLAAAQTVPSPGRGKLLYETHCITCHTTQMHWRERRLAKDWDSLKAQVLKWQANAGLQWSDDEIADVARHLNDTIYQLPQPGERVGVAPSSAR